MATTELLVDMGSSGLGLCLYDSNGLKISEDKLRFVFQAIVRDNNGLIPIDIQEQVVRALVKFMEEKRLIRARGIATAWARVSSNSADFLVRLKKEANVDITIIDQQMEAILGHKAIMVHLRSRGDCDDRKIVAWDVGGGSMQLSTLESGNVTFIGNKVSSVSFADLVLMVEKGIQRPTIADTPNPLSSIQKNHAIQLACASAELFTHGTSFKSMKGKRVIGLGLLKYMLQYINRLNQTSNDYFTLADIQSATEKLVDKNNDEIGALLGCKSADARNRFTSMLLLTGYMIQLNIEQVEVIDGVAGVGGLLDN